MFPERFSNLPAYAFPRLRALLDVHEPVALCVTCRSESQNMPFRHGCQKSSLNILRNLAGIPPQ